MKTLFTVRAIRQPDDYAGGPGVGPWFVEAKSPRGAFRIVRNNWAAYIHDHVSREMYVLECNGVLSDRRGKLLAHRSDNRQAYAGPWR